MGRWLLISCPPHEPTFFLKLLCACRFAYWTFSKSSMPPKNRRGRGRTTKDKGRGHLSRNGGGSRGSRGGYGDYYPYCNGGKCKGRNRGADARELLRLKKKEEGKLRAKARALAVPTAPLQVMAQAAPVSPIDGTSGALGEEAEEAPPDVPAGVCRYIPKLLALANDDEIMKGAPFNTTPDTSALCQRMANEAHKDVLPGDGHATAMEAIKGEFGLRTSATTTPGLLKIMFAAIACRKIRMQRRLIGLGTAQGQKPKLKSRR